MPLLIFWLKAMRNVTFQRQGQVEIWNNLQDFWWNLRFVCFKQWIFRSNLILKLNRLLMRDLEYGWEAQLAYNLYQRVKSVNYALKLRKVHRTLIFPSHHILTSAYSSVYYNPHNSQPSPPKLANIIHKNLIIVPEAWYYDFWLKFSFFSSLKSRPAQAWVSDCVPSVYWTESRRSAS